LGFKGQILLPYILKNSNLLQHILTPKHLRFKTKLLQTNTTIMRGLRRNVIRVVQRRCQSCFQPYDQAWHGRHKLYTKWTKQTFTFIKELICCALCGVTKMNNKKLYYKILLNTYTNACNPKPGCTPYGMANALLVDHITSANGHKINVCLKCKSNMTAPPNSRYVIYHISTPLYPPIHCTSSSYHS
jgi:hypothetical protein